MLNGIQIQEDQELNLAQAAKLAGMKSPAFCYHLKDGKFPPPFRVVAGRKVFRASEIREWKKQFDLTKG